MIEQIKKQVTIFAQVLSEVPQLTYAGNPVLRRVTTEVTLSEGLEIAKQLQAVLLQYRKITGAGRGLAAPQIGESKAVFVTYLNDTFETFINPKISKQSQETNFYKELCMSVGIMAADVERASWIQMEWTDADGVEHSEQFDGFKARLYQHEEAHLRGLLNIDEVTYGAIEFATFDPLQEKLRSADDV